MIKKFLIFLTVTVFFFGGSLLSAWVGKEIALRQTKDDFKWINFLDLEDFPSSLSTTTTPPKTISPSKKPSVECAGCEKIPAVSVAPTSQPKSVTTSRQSGRVTTKYNYTADIYYAADSQEAYPHELVYDVLKRQELGHLSSKVSIPDVTYSSQGTLIRPNVYSVAPKDVSLTKNAVIGIVFTIRVPSLTNEQFLFLKDKKDYRFVYGLMKGIVGHEETHYKYLREYISEVVNVLNNPLTATQEISAENSADFQNKINTILLKTIERRLAAAKARHDQNQTRIDTPAGQDIIFNFEEEVNGKVPPPIKGDFQGEATFVFDLPEGSVPRPPLPNIELK